MPVALLNALLLLLTDAPQLVNGAKSLWAALATFHIAGVIVLTADQLTAMNAAGVQLDSDIASLQKAAGNPPAVN